MQFFNVDRHSWIWFGIAVGILIVLASVLLYIVMWSTRKLELEDTEIEITNVRTFLIWLQATVPWVLILTYLGTLALALIYPWVRMHNPPNW